MPRTKVITEAIPSVSIVVVTFHGRHHLARCLPAIDRLEYPRERIQTIVVDNGIQTSVVDNGIQTSVGDNEFRSATAPGESGSGAAELVRGSHPRVLLVESSRNRGFAGGNNLGLAHARGELVVFLNDDTVVEPGWLTPLVEAANDNPDVAFCTSKLLFLSERRPVIQSAGSVVYENGFGQNRGAGAEDVGQFDQTEEVFAACGASMLARRSVLQEIGAFDERFFMYYEDTDLSWRARLAGYRILFVPRSVARHAHHGTLGERSARFVYLTERNRLLMLAKDARLRRFLRALSRFPPRIAVLAARERSTDTWEQRSRARLRALRDVIGGLPASMRLRAQVQASRRRAPSEVERWLRPVP